MKKSPSFSVRPLFNISRYCHERGIDYDGYGGSIIVKRGHGSFMAAGRRDICIKGHPSRFSIYVRGRRRVCVSLQCSRTEMDAGIAVAEWLDSRNLTLGWSEHESILELGRKYFYVTNGSTPSTIKPFLIWFESREQAIEWSMRENVQIHTCEEASAAITGIISSHYPTYK
jgi:hypothetical protein